ncbi:MAG: hypothetical protein LAT67_08730 [Balneolales bacterium]|nr:hypothetical protein [Balneolales bacterium]
MLEKTSFHKSFDTDIIVANIGINRDDWFCYKHGDKQSEIRDIMLKKKFDIVPVLKKNGDVNEYFQLTADKQLYTTLIDESHKLYYRTHIHDVIWKMTEEGRDFYFLTHGRSGDNIIGLISLCNFNCREFYIYLFGLISFVERELATMITCDFDEAFQILKNRAQNDDLQKQVTLVQKRFYHDREMNSDNDFREYLYLGQLISLLCEKEEYLKLGYTEEKSFIKNTGKVREIRNRVAHPVKSLIKNHEDLKNLKKGLDKLYELKNNIENYRLAAG